VREISTEDNFFSIWLPRIIIGVCVVLLIYFTQRTYRFSGKFDETFNAPENLNLVRGPWAKNEYYKRGELGYVGKPLFEDSEAVGSATGEVEMPTELLQSATESLSTGTQ
jgi:hypothetical protein